MEQNVIGELKVKTYDRRTFVQSVCDLIDNSIDGHASKVEIINRRSNFLGKPDYALMVLDNGNGIKPENMLRSYHLVQCCEEGYEEWELGSFGVGLKDASLAQAHEVTLVSKRKGGVVELLRLSKLFVTIKKDWKILTRAHLESVDLISTSIQYAIDRLEKMDSGTAVIWEDLHSLSDKIIPDDDTQTETLMARHEEKVKDYISMTFADYLIGLDLGPRIKENPLQILFNGALSLHLTHFSSQI